VAIQELELPKYEGQAAN